MNTSTVTPVGQTIFFQTAYGEIKKGSYLFLDVGPGKIGKDKKEYLGFQPIKVKRFGGKFNKPPILIIRVGNQEHFKPEISGERWKVLIKDTEVTPQLTTNKKFQRVLLHIEAIERVENTFEYYDKKSKQYVVETRSGRLTISRDIFETEEEETEFRNKDKDYIMTVTNVYARVNESARQLIYQSLFGGVYRQTLVDDRSAELFNNALKTKKHGTSKSFRGQAEQEIENRFNNLPEMPAVLK